MARKTKEVTPSGEKTDYEKLMDIFDYVIKTHNVRLNVPTIKKIYEIDNNFNFDRFNIDASSVLKKIPIEILYNPYPSNRYRSNVPKPVIPMKEMNTGNCCSISIYNVLSYKISEKSESLTDINEFIKNIDSVTSFVCADYDWRSGDKKGETEYQVKYLKSKTKTLRFVLHSDTKKAHNLNAEQNKYRDCSD